MIDSVIIEPIGRNDDEGFYRLVESERARLIAKMRSAKAGGSPTQAPRARVSLHFHCDDVIYSNE